MSELPLERVQQQQQQITQNIVISKILVKEQQLIENSETTVTDYKVRETAYKRQKVESSGAVILNSWRDTDHSFYDQKSFQFVDDEEVDDQISQMSEDANPLERKAGTNSKRQRLLKLAEMLEVEYQSSEEEPPLVTEATIP